MRLSPMLPARLRVDLHRAAATLRSLRRTARRPVYAARHSQEQLEAFRRDAERARAALRDVDDAAGVATLTVRAVHHPIPDAVTIAFDRPPGERWDFVPGQHVTLRVAVDGDVHRRPYSLCSDPADADTLAVTVKRVAGGLVSNHLVDHVRAGQRVDVLGPHGRFGTAPDPARARRVILVAGGSGITPLMSIARALLRAEPASMVELIYANRGWRSIIFRSELAALASASSRLAVRHVLERPSRRLACETGRLEGEVLTRVLPLDGDEYYVCGPAPMMASVCSALSDAGVPDAHVHVERFTSAARTMAPASGAVWSVTFARSGRMVQVNDDQTLLEAAAEAGLFLPRSCSMGGCGACAQRLVSGDVAMDEPNCLTAAERGEGAVLCCVGRPRGPVVIDA